MSFAQIHVDRFGLITKRLRLISGDCGKQSACGLICSESVVSLSREAHLVEMKYYMQFTRWTMKMEKKLVSTFNFTGS